jgi:pyruvate formate lyase activating enzyme
MLKGIVFDIKEFAVHDGPGIRTTVFLKGCPLRCSWCHNPEGLEQSPQILKSPVGERKVGEQYTPEKLADLLNAQGEFLRMNKGGVTFSGGEPLMQAPFVSRVIDRLAGIHVLLDTSGYAAEDEFREVVEKCDLVYYDIKIMEESRHRKYTGKGNRRILTNLLQLGELEVPFVVRVPLVPGVTDTPDNLASISQFLTSNKMSGLQGVDFLPYNRAAGGKYSAVGRKFNPGFDENQTAKIDTDIFSRIGVEVKIIAQR